MNSANLVIVVIAILVLSAVYISFDGSYSGNIIKNEQKSISKLLDEAEYTKPNITQDMAIKPPIITSNFINNTKPQIKDPCEKIVCKNSTKLCPDGIVANCKNTCLNGNCSNCEASCVGHDKPNESPKTTIASVQNNAICSESWTCSEWSACQNNQQIKTCADSNNCGTEKNKPTETQSCQENVNQQTTQAKQPEIVNIKFDADGDDKMKENWNTEWVEMDGRGVDISGWVLSDAANHTFVFQDNFIIDGTIKIHSGDGENTQTDLYWNGGRRPIWNNDGDVAYLKDKNGNLVDQYSYE